MNAKVFNLFAIDEPITLEVHTSGNVHIVQCINGNYILGSSWLAKINLGEL